MNQASIQEATLGGGCFWCMEAVFELVDGVVEVIPGYAGGHVPEPTYEQVSTGQTGHAEVVRLRFNPAKIGYGDLLDIFLAVHDPTTVDRQGPDVGPQYRSIILYHDDAQRQEALQALARVNASGAWKNPAVTAVEPLVAFYPAEEYHRHYFQRHPEQAYCQVVINPKVAHARSLLGQRLKPALGRSSAW
jgi:peptide-methionine (S)-S-oxide reductase